MGYGCGRCVNAGAFSLHEMQLDIVLQWMLAVITIVLMRHLLCSVNIGFLWKLSGKYKWKLWYNLTLNIPFSLWFSTTVGHCMVVLEFLYIFWEVINFLLQFQGGGGVHTFTGGLGHVTIRSLQCSSQEKTYWRFSRYVYFDNGPLGIEKAIKSTWHDCVYFPFSRGN